MRYYFHVTITRRQRIVHVHVMLLQRAEFNVVMIDFHVPHESLVVPGALLVEGGKCLSYLFAVKSVASAGE